MGHRDDIPSILGSVVRGWPKTLDRVRPGDAEDARQRTAGHLPPFAAAGGPLALGAWASISRTLGAEYGRNPARRSSILSRCPLFASAAIPWLGVVRVCLVLLVVSVLFWWIVLLLFVWVVSIVAWVVFFLVAGPVPFWGRWFSVVARGGRVCGAFGWVVRGCCADRRRFFRRVLLSGPGFRGGGFVDGGFCRGGVGVCG